MENLKDNVDTFGRHVNIIARRRPQTARRRPQTARKKVLEKENINRSLSMCLKC